MNKVPTKITSKKSTSDVATKATQKSNRKEEVVVINKPQEVVNNLLKQLQKFYNSTQDGMSLSNEKKGTTYKTKYANMKIINKAYNNIPTIKGQEDLLIAIRVISKAFDLIKETWEIEYSTTVKELHFNELEPRKNFETKQAYKEYLKQQEKDLKTQKEIQLRNLNKLEEKSKKILEHLLNIPEETLEETSEETTKKATKKTTKKATKKTTKKDKGTE